MTGAVDQGGGSIAIPAFGFWERIVWAYRFALRHFFYWLGLHLLIGLAVVGIVIGGLLYWPGLATLQSGLASGASSVPLTPEALLLSRALISILLIGSVGLFVSLVYATALYRFPVRYLELGRRPSFGSLLGDAISRLPDMLTATAVISLVMLVLVIAVGSLPFWLGHPTPATMLIAQIAAVLVVLFVVLSLTLTAPLLANERISAWTALRYSWVIARARRLSILFYVIAMTLVTALMGVAWQWLTTIMPLSLGVGPAYLPIGALLLSAGLFILGIIAGPALMMGLTTYYLESKVLVGGWIPPWRIPLKPGWPVGGGEPEPVRGRGLRGWRDFLILNAALGLLAWGASASWPQWRKHLNLPGQIPIKVLTPAPTPASPDEAPPTPMHQTTHVSSLVMPEAPVTIKARVDGIFSTGNDGLLRLKWQLDWDARPLPGKASLDHLLRWEIQRIRDTRGRELYTDRVRLPGRPVQSVRLTPLEEGRYTGTADLPLARAIEPDELATIEGVLYWRHPSHLDVVEIELTAPTGSGTWQKRAIHWRRLSKRQVALTGGHQWDDSLLTLTGVTPDGEAMPPADSRFSAGSRIYRFAKEVDRLRLYFVRGDQTIQSRFTLRQHRPYRMVVRAGKVSERTVSSLPPPGAGLVGSLQQARLRQWIYRTVRQGDCTAARPWIDGLIGQVPNDGWLYLVRAKCRLQAGETAGAREDLSKACAHGQEEACGE